MREIEILVELKDSLEKALSCFSKYPFEGKKQIIDTYYFDPLRPDLKLNEKNKLMACCRVRQKNEKTYLTYKTDFYEKDKWLYSDEHETQVDSADEIHQILKALGLQKLVTIDNTKYTFKTDVYEIVIEDVQNLGLFLEVECKKDDETKSVQEIKNKIQQFMDETKLNIGQELNSGKPELLLNKMDK